MLDILERIMALQVMEHKHSSVVATTFIQRVASKRLYFHGSLVGYFFFYQRMILKRFCKCRVSYLCIDY